MNKHITSLLRSIIDWMMHAKRAHLELIDTAIFASAFFLVVYMTQSLWPAPILLILSIWNYWSGGRSTIETCARKHAREVVALNERKISDALIEDFESIKPGQAITYHVAVKKPGNEKPEKLFDIVMIDEADFEHILALAKLKASEVIRRDGEKR